MYLKLSPKDFAIFRDCKPFSAGSEHKASTIFPPGSATIFHALRTAVMENEGEDFSDPGRYSGEAIDRMTGVPLSIRGMWMDHDGAYLPAPADLRIPRKKSERKTRPLSVLPLAMPTRGKNNTGLPAMTVMTDTETKGLAGCWIGSGDFRKYLLADAESMNYSGLAEPVDIREFETRVGIKLSKHTRSTEEGQLYSVRGFTLRKGWSFGVWTNEVPKLMELSWIFLGGERRVFTCETGDNDLSLPTAGEIAALAMKRDGWFKLVLLTPACFRDGWKPSWIGDDLGARIGGVGIKLQAALVGNPLKWGGYDIAKNHPKPLRNLVPAGSVYYFRIDDVSMDSTKRVIEALHLKNITEEGERFGFGLAVTGGVKDVP